MGFSDPYIPKNIFFAWFSRSKGIGSALEAEKGSQFTCFWGLRRNVTLFRMSFQALPRPWKRQTARSLRAFGPPLKKLL